MQENETPAVEVVDEVVAAPVAEHPVVQEPDDDLEDNDPPVYDPPTDEPPKLMAARDLIPVQEPDAAEPPMQEPPDEEPPAEKEPEDGPEEEEPPFNDPPTGEPSRDDPPSEEPDEDVPLVREPDEDLPGLMATHDLIPVQEPDAAEPPVHEPPDEEPPAEKEPKDDPEEEEPAVDDPPTGEPSRDDPPSEEPDEDAPSIREPDQDSPGLMAAEDLIPEDLLPDTEPEATHDATHDIIRLRAIVEAIVYLTDEPLSVDQLAGALRQEKEVISRVLADLTAEFEKPEHGVAIREVAGGFAMATKPEHHEEVRAFVKNMQAPMKLSLPSLETLAVIAYRQPITAPEVMEIRGVQGAGVLKTLLDRKLIAAAGRKNVIGKPILYKTTKEFLVQFGLRDLAELPSLKEFEEIGRMSIADEPAPLPEPLQPLLPVPSESLPEATPANGK